MVKVVILVKKQYVIRSVRLVMPVEWQYGKGCKNIDMAIW
jgi:hypothetical protein